MGSASGWGITEDILRRENEERRHKEEERAGREHNRCLAGIPESPWDEVIPGLWVGGSERGFPGATFGAVVSTYDWHRDRGRWLPASGVPHIVVPFLDSSEVPSLDVIYCAQQVAHWRDVRNKSVLVRCQAGLNRSSLVVATYLMTYKGYSAGEAIGAVRRARGDDALFNETFRQWLHDLER